MKYSLRTFFSVSVFMLVAASMLYSDEETRKAAQTEKDFYKEVMTTLSNAIPKCPEG
jgi:hypothetical protein